MKNFTPRLLSLSVLLLWCAGAVAQTTTTFSYTGGMQTYTVPAGVTFLTVEVRGAEGGAGMGAGGGAAGGTGSIVTGTLTVTPGMVLNLFVGSAGTPFSGGFNGGGNNSPGGGGGGGGATDIRIGGLTTAQRVIVAAGGGGGGGGPLTGYAGGKGGAASGEDGLPLLSLGGKGGTQSIGGPGGGTAFCGGTGLPGNMGSFGLGANGTGSGGGGGGGFYGGGSGGSNGGGTCSNGAGGGGGGSSAISTAVVSNATISQGGNTGNGYITITTPHAPTATTQSSSGVTTTTAIVYGTVADNGAATTTYFEYSNSPTLGSGVNQVAATPPSINAGAGSTGITATLSGLNSNTTYYYRVKAVNSVGTTNGAILSFTTPNQAPEFISGATQAVAMCQGSKDFNLTSLLHVSDVDPAQTITWTIAAMPNHNGVLGGFGSANFANSGSANLSPNNTISYTPATGFKGTETFKIQVSDGKASDTIEFTATVHPLPAPIISRVGPDLSTGLFDIYQWYRNNVAIVGATTQTYTMTEGGDYHVTVSDVNGCTATSNIFKYPTVSVGEVAGAGGIAFYPNPVYNVLHIAAGVEVNVAITAIDGRVVLQQRAAQTLDMSSLPAGLYTLKIYDTAGALLKLEKLVKAND